MENDKDNNVFCKNSRDEVTVEKSWDMDIKSMANIFTGIPSNKESGGGALVNNVSTTSKTSNHISEKFNRIMQSDTEVCCICEKRVYPLEKITANKKIYHKSCFRCTKCCRIVSVCNYSVNEDKIFCKPHFMELFKIRGRYDERKYPEKNNNAVDTTCIAITSKDDHHQSSRDSSSDNEEMERLVDDEFPPEGYSKSILNKFRQLESSKDHEPSVKISNGHHHTGEALIDVDDDDEAKHGSILEMELPPADITKSLASKFRAMETSCSVPPPTPEKSHQLGQDARRGSGANNNIRLPNLIVTTSNNAVLPDYLDEEKDHHLEEIVEHVREVVDDDSCIIIRNEFGNEKRDEELPQAGVTKNILAMFQVE